MKLLRNVILQTLSGIVMGMLGGTIISVIYYAVVVISISDVVFLPTLILHAVLTGCLLGGLSGFIMISLAAIVQSSTSKRKQKQKRKRNKFRIYGILTLMGILYAAVFPVISPNLTYFFILMTLCLVASHRFLCFLLQGEPVMIPDWL